MKVPVIDRFGNAIGAQLGNMPIEKLYPDEPVVIIDWLYDIANKKVPLNKPTLDELRSPIMFKGNQFYGNLAWGSMVKKGKTIGITHDFPHESGMVKATADGQRVGRWLLHNGFYGFRRRKLRLLIVDSDYKLDDGTVIQDGGSAIRSSMAYDAWTKEPKVKLGKTRESFTWWQRIPWSFDLERELIPYMDRMVETLSDPMNLLMDQPASWLEKQELVEIDDDMLLHPYVAGALVRNAGEYLSRAATTVNLNPEYLVAVGTLMPYWVWPGHWGNLSLARFPIDADSSIAGKVIENTLDYQAESERIAKVEVTQNTLASKNFFIKNCTVLSEAIPQGYDGVICKDDIKMSVNDLDVVRKMHDIEDEFVFSIGMWWDKGSAMGVNVNWGKTEQKWDLDGDAGHLKDCNQTPHLFKAIRSLPSTTSIKLNKWSPLIEKDDQRTLMISKSMVNLIGAASNVVADTYMVSDREAFAENIGFETKDVMDAKHNYNVTCGTDGYKTTIDLEAVMSDVMREQSKIIKVYKQGAQWTSWPDPVPPENNEDPGYFGIFRYRLPLVEDEYTDWDALSYNEKFHMIKLWQDGTVPNIARLMLPKIAPYLDNLLVPEPLSTFKPWALEVDESQYALGEIFQMQYEMYQKNIDWNDGEQKARMKAAFREDVRRYIRDTGMDPKIMASALWRVSCSKRGARSQGASVFWAFPEEAKWIVREKPGLAKVNTNQTPYIVNGLNMQLPMVSSLTVQVEVKTIDLKVKRRVLIAKVQGQIQPNDPYPENMIGIVAQNCDQPEPGKYMAYLEPVSAKSHRCFLTAL